MERAQERIDNVVEAMAEFLEGVNDVEEFRSWLAGKTFLKVCIASHLMRLFNVDKKDTALRAVQKFLTGK